jgi:hypothetical protein
MCSQTAVLGLGTFEAAMPRADIAARLGWVIFDRSCALTRHLMALRGQLNDAASEGGLARRGGGEH